MGKEKTVKTNAMRMLDRLRIPYEVNIYECSEFIDGIHIADMLGQSYDNTLKTLVTIGKSREYFVFAIPIHKELDVKKAAGAVSEKSIELIHVKDIMNITGYIRGGCSPLGMKKQFRTVIDQSVSGCETVIISGGKIGTQILLCPQDLLSATNGTYEDLCM